MAQACRVFLPFPGSERVKDHVCLLFALFVLQTLLCDVSSLAAEFGGGSWTQDDLHQLEGELLLGTSEPLCLDPSPVVAMVATELTRQQKMFNEPSLRRSEDGWFAG